MNSVKDFRGKIELPVEKGVLKIERYAQRLTQGYSEYGGSYLWAPGLGQKLKWPKICAGRLYKKSRVVLCKNCWKKHQIFEK